MHELFICEYDNFVGVFPGPFDCAYLTITTSFAGNGRWFQLIYCLSYALKLRFKFCTASCSSQVATITWPWPWGHCHCYLTTFFLFLFSVFAWLVWMGWQGFISLFAKPLWKPRAIDYFFSRLSCRRRYIPSCLSVAEFLSRSPTSTPSLVVRRSVIYKSTDDDSAELEWFFDAGPPKEFAAPRRAKEMGRLRAKETARNMKKLLTNSFHLYFGT